LICFLTFVFISEGFAGTIELAASTVHQFISGKCEIGAPQVERFSNSRPVCTAENPSAKSIRDLKVPMIYVKESEDSYLQALSSQREQDLRCEAGKLQFLVNHPAQVESVVDSIRNMAQIDEQLLALEARARKTARMDIFTSLNRPDEVAGKVDLIPTPIGSEAMGPAAADRNEAKPAAESGQPTTKLISEEIAKLRLAREVIAASMPASDTSEVQNFIRSRTQSSVKETGDVELGRQVVKLYQNLQKSVQAEAVSYQPVVSSIAPLMGHTKSELKLSSAQKNSLAKDMPLVEKILSRSGDVRDRFALIACQANAKYGQGRDQLDFGLSVGSLPLAGVGFGMVKALNVARLGGALSMASRAEKLERLALRLGKAGVALDLASLGSAVERSCGQQNQVRFSMSELKIGNGDMNQLNLLGSAKSEPIKHNQRDAADICGAAGVLAEAKHSECVTNLLLASLGATAWIKTPVSVGQNPQLAIWELQAAGKNIAAEELERYVTDILKNGIVTKQTPIFSILNGSGVNRVERIKFRAANVEGVWKPASSSISLPEHEIAAMLVDRKLGLNSVPIVVRRDFNRTSGTVHLFVKETKTQATQHRDPVELLFFDLLIGNNDRHGRNYLKTKNGKTVAIDHDLNAFTESRTDELKRALSEIRYQSNKTQELLQLRTNISNLKSRGKAVPEWMIQSETTYVSALKNSKEESARVIGAMQLHPEAIEKLKSITEPQWRKDLAPLLNPQQMNAFLARRKILLELGSLSQKMPQF
jgi:hypothetical protein